MPLETLLYLVVILLIVGLGLALVQRAPIDATIKWIIYVIVFVAIAFWLLTKVLPAAGLGA